MNTPMDAKLRAIVAAQHMPLRKAGPFLAASGLPVFPCARVGKVPLIEHGLLDATVDGRKAERWWARWPEANIGVPTGPTSGFDVVDVDVRDTGSGYEPFHRAVTQLKADGWAMRVLTPSGGMHFYYPADPGRPQANWVSAKTHVDFRGAGGSIILPPSVGLCGHDLRQPYTLIEVRSSAYPIDAEALRDFLDPEWARRRFAARLDRLPRTETRETALKTWVATRTEGERNAGLFWAACRMAEAGHPMDTTLDALAASAQQCGLLDREILVTVQSAYRHANPDPSARIQQVPSRPFVAERRAVMAL